MRPTRCELAGEVLLEGAVVAQAGERVGHRDLGQALDLGRAGRRQARGGSRSSRRVRAARRPMPIAKAKVVATRMLPCRRRSLGGVREPGGGRGARGTSDAVLEHAVGRVDDLVLEVLHARSVAGVDGGEQAPARGTVGPLQGEQPRDRRGRWPATGRARSRGAARRSGGGRRRRARRGRGRSPRGGTRARSTSPRRPSGARSGSVAARQTAVSARCGEVGRPALGDEREAARGEQHGEDRRRLPRGWPSVR